MGYRDPADMIPETPSMVRRRALKWFGGGAGIGLGIGLVVSIALAIRSCPSTPAPRELCEQDARRYTRDLFREARWVGSSCVRDGDNRCECAVFVRWPDRTERRVLECRPGDGCQEDHSRKTRLSQGDAGAR